MSLRARIVVWFVVATTILIFTLTFTAQRLIVAGLSADVDARLRLQADVVASAINSAGASSTGDYAKVVRQVAERQLVSFPIVIRIAAPDGKINAVFGDVPASIVPGLDLALTLLGTDDSRFDDVQLPGGSRNLRVYTAEVFDPSTSNAFAIIQTAISLAAVAAAESKLWQYAIVEGILGSLLALSAGLIIWRRGFRPLEKILNRVQEIKDINLVAGLPAEPRPPELQRLADSLNAMWRRLDAALSAKEAFMASISHELRTPLTAIQGQIDFLRRQPSDSPEVEESLERTAGELRRLIRMTNNLLLNAQLESKPAFLPQSVNLRELVEGVIKDTQVLAGGRDLKLKLEEGEDVLVSGDYDLLKQAVINIADNAIKFTPEKGLVRLTLQQEEGWIVLEVSDSGPGIPREHLPHIMERFYQVPTSGRTQRGAGLGLAIVKQVIELHGGQVRIQSQVGTGTRVRMYLPVKKTSDLKHNGRTG